MLALAEDSVLVVVDIQPMFLNPIFQADRVLERSKFLCQAAKLLDVPILATEQYPERMGGTHPEILEHLDSVFGKKAFSCLGSEKFNNALAALERSQVILCGIETHICVNQTAHDLLDVEAEVILATDAISARSEQMHEIGIRRMRDEGVVAAHSESIVYEWMESADHPAFKDVLKLVKG